MSTVRKTEFLSECCPVRVIIECDESVWSVKQYCKECQTKHYFWRDRVIPEPKSSVSPSVLSVPDSVYLFRAGNRYKIGISKDPKKRLHHLSASPVPVELVWSLQVRDAQELERQLHETFQGKRVHGEWFELDETDIAYIKGLETPNNPYG